MSLAGTGEEWKAMDEVSGAYKPDDALIVAAKQNIERIRKRDVELRLVDRAGKPIAHAPVEVVQKKGAFCFGDQLWGLAEMYRFNEHLTDKAKAFTHRFTEALNSANALCYWTERPRNDGPKTEDIQGDNITDNFAWCVDWGNANGLTMKGHPLFWSIQKCVPEWVKRYDYATQLKFAEVRVRNLVARFKGKVKLWDAVNEPMWEPAFKNLPKRNWPHLDPIADIADYIELVLTWCRDEDPDAIYTINDYGMEKDPENGPPVALDGTKATAGLQRKRFLQLMAALHERGTPPDALGLQSHTGGWLDHKTQLAVYDEMATSGLPLHITEFWADTHHLEKQGKLPIDVIRQMQAEYVANYLTCAFGHSAIGAFFFWGFMSHAIEWFKRSSHEPRPMFDRVRDLIKNEWLTRATLTTDADGKARFRGFYGDYVLRHAISPKSRTGVPFTVAREDAMPLSLRL